VNPTGYAFLGLTGIVAALVALLVFAVLRFAMAAKHARRSLGDTKVETALLATALEDAIGRLKAQERATAARAEASERLSDAIVLSLTSGLIVVDSQGAVQILNPAARQILGLAARDDASNVRRVAPALADVIDESFRTRSTILRRTVLLMRPDGQRHLGVTVSPLAGEGSSNGAICVFRDLTSIIALEEQLRLKEALARLGELTAGLAHEFRNGLATIHGYARLLDLAQLAPSQQPYLEGIRTETQALGDVVTKFLDFAKPGPLAMAPLDLHALVQRAADDLPGAVVTITGEFETIDGDEVLLRQALSNLLRNGVDACAAVGQPPRVSVHGRIDRTDQTMQVAVADDGPGISAAAMPRLFQPFFTTRPGGTGLGLAIVQKVLVSHNGRVTAANRPEGGATITIHLPRRSAENGTEP
jgi:two-component system sensor histidine kinase PilS (NtrC family)